MPTPIDEPQESCLRSWDPLVQALEDMSFEDYVLLTIALERKSKEIKDV